MIGKVTERISDYVVRTSFDDLPDDVVRKAKRTILDSIGCALGGYKTETGRIVTDLAAYLDGRRESTVIGSGDRVACTHAAFANSTMSNVLDFDDTTVYPIGHPGSTVIPPALAVGESVGASGEDLITSVVLGYEISLRVADAIESTLEQRRKVIGYATRQTFGAVTAASKLLSLNKAQVLNAIGIAGASAPVPSLLKTVSTMVKNNFGRASEVGVVAALLAKRGFTGPMDILEGDTGFWRMASSDRCDFGLMTEGSGEKYRILAVAFKPYSACRWIHSTLDAALKIMKDHHVNIDRIKKIIVKSFKQVTDLRNYEPKSIFEAQFSVPYSLAVAITGEEPGPGWFTEKKMKDPKILELAKKIELSTDPEAEKEYPYKWVATVEIITEAKGFTAHVDYPKGDPRNPMSDHEMRRKFLSLARDVFTGAKAEKIIKIIRKLEELDNITELTKLFARS